MIIRVSSAMKLITFFAACAITSLVTFLCSLPADQHTLSLFSGAAIALILLGVVRDYAPRRPLWQPGRRPLSGATRLELPATEPMRRAA